MQHQILNGSLELDEDMLRAGVYVGEIGSAHSGLRCVGQLP